MSAAIPLISHDRPGSVFAYRGGKPVQAAAFVHEVRRLAQCLPERTYMLNLCTDRYRFTVGFCAALLRGQTSLLPPNYARDFVEQLSARYTGTYCLTDGATDASAVEKISYPEFPDDAGEEFVVPGIPATQRAAMVFTSGSTGQPVAHEKTWGSLIADGIAEAEALGIAAGSGLAILGTVPPQHMYGLESTVLIAMQNGLALVAEKPFYPADICAQLQSLPVPRCLVTTPVHLRTLLDEVDSVPAVDFVMCATAPLSAQLASEAEARFNAPLYEIYGCTEAGQLASRRPTQSTAWRLMSGIRLRQDKSGTWAHGGHVEIEAPLSDVIELNPDGTFMLHGRSADMVNIAGKRTSLSSLNHHLNAIEGVRDGVFVLPEEAGKEVARPMAFVVAPGLSSDKVLSALRTCIDPVFLPRPLYFVDALPRNATGKLTREALRQLMQQCTGK
jgi:acyl-coenzyme A synthetase/AMP-(fatty) acid ligase